MRVSGRTAVAIASSIERGLIARQSGGQLPTVRELAATLHVSPATVASAYKLLRTRGLVTGNGRRGTRVTTVTSLPTPSADSHPAAIDARDLASGTPDETLFPALEPALRSMELESMTSGGGPHQTALAAFASGDFEADGIPAGTVTVLGGGLDAIERILREHLRTGDRVAVEDPSFRGVLDLVSTSGYTVAPFDVDEEGPVPDSVDAALRRGCQAIVVTSRAQDPTGAAVSESRADELRRRLRRFPTVVLIEHDPAGPVAGAPFHSLRHHAHERWAVVRSLPAFLGSELRVAVVAGDAVTSARVQARQALAAGWVSHILQQLALTLWSSPQSGRRLARAGEMYTHRRTAALAALRERGMAAIGRSGFNVWVPVPDEPFVVRALAQRGWAVAAGERFRIQSGPGIRITISTLSPEDAGRLAADLAGALGPAAGAPA